MDINKTENEKSIFTSMATSAGIHIGLCIILTIAVFLSYNLFHVWVEKAWGQNAVYPIPLAVFLLAGLTMLFGSIYAAFPWFVAFAIGAGFARAIWAYLWLILLLTLMGVCSFTIIVATSWPGLEQIVKYGLVSWVRGPLNESLNAIVSLSLMSPYHVKIQVESFSELAEMVNNQFYPILFILFLALIGPRVAKLFYRIKKGSTVTLISACMLIVGAVDVIFFEKSLHGLLLANTSLIFVSYPNDTMWACRINWMILLSAAIIGRITEVLYTLVHHDSLKKTRTDIRRPSL